MPVQFLLTITNCWSMVWHDPLACACLHLAFLLVDLWILDTDGLALVCKVSSLMVPWGYLKMVRLTLKFTKSSRRFIKSDSIQTISELSTLSCGLLLLLTGFSMLLLWVFLLMVKTCDLSAWQITIFALLGKSLGIVLACCSYVGKLHINQ